MNDKDNRADEDDSLQQTYLDGNEFVAKFLFNPDIHDEADYTHIDKNLSVTKLSTRQREPEQARHILKALHVLNNNKYFRDIVVEEKTGRTVQDTFYHYICPNCSLEGYDREGNEKNCKCGTKITPEKFVTDVPEYQKVIRRKSLFPRSFHNIKARFYALTTTSMARDGHLMKSATSRHYSKDETVEDQTKVKGNPFSLVSGKQNKE